MKVPRRFNLWPKRRRLPKFDRILIGLFLAVAVILPYVVSSLRIGDLPPAQFAAGSRELAVFNQVDSLQAGDLALIAAEYGPTGAGELDPALDALLRHVLLRGAHPVIGGGEEDRRCPTGRFTRGAAGAGVGA